MSEMVTRLRLTSPRAMARELALRTVPSGATTSVADGRTLRTRMTSSGTAGVLMVGRRPDAPPVGATLERWRRGTLEG